MKRSSTFRRLLLLAALAATALMLCLRSPHQTGHYPPCPFAASTGLHCPGCGTLRALHALLHGDLLQALAYNSLAIVLLPLIVGTLVWGAIAGLRGRRYPARSLPAWMLYLFVALIFVYSVLRNIPVAPFNNLAPHEIAQQGDREKL